MKKFLIIICAIVLVITATWFIFDSTKVKRNQTKEIGLEYALKPAFKKDNLQDLPLLRFESKKVAADYFIIMLPGDGGWRDFIDYLSNYLSGNGINVVGLNTIPYFNNVRKPAEIAHDMQRIMNNFSEVWGKKKVVLAGYSFGAEILPFIYNRLDSNYKARVICLTMIAPSNLADFKVSPIYYYNPSKSLAVLPELQKIRNVRTLIFCDRQKKSLCNYTNSKDPFDMVPLEYGHLFTGKFRQVSATITARMILETEKK